jgi:hypothetical protein
VVADDEPGLVVVLPGEDDDVLGIVVAIVVVVRRPLAVTDDAEPHAERMKASPPVRMKLCSLPRPNNHSLQLGTRLRDYHWPFGR